MKNFTKFWLVLILFTGLFWQSNNALAQCAMCRATVESNALNKESEVGKGLNAGILYLMTIPYLLVGTVGYVFYRYQKKAKQKAALRNNSNRAL